jgi:hypothetical protein
MTTQDRAVCVGCGQSIGIGVAPNIAGLCERCAELAPFLLGGRAGEPGETAGEEQRRRRHDAVGRLRERYHEARALTLEEGPERSHHINLDWILGSEAGDGRGAPFDARTSALVLLWLEDLIRDLDASRGSSDAEADSPAGRWDATAHGLRCATREFAAAFLGPEVAAHRV